MIVEDELINARGIERMLGEVCPHSKILATLDSVESSIEWFSQNPQPDLVLMDIHLADGLCFEIFDRVQLISPVIFITAYDKYALNAFKVNSVDYLLKPLQKKELTNAIKKVESLYSVSPKMYDKINDLSNYIKQHPRKIKERFLVHDKGGMAPVSSDEVAYFIKDSLIYLVSISNHRYVTDYHTLEEIEACMNPEKFFRANRQIIIHKNQVSHYKKHYTGKLTVFLKSDSKLEVDVSREKSHDFIRWIEYGV
ncbi:MAG: LytTR family DNA-binding domain-containing protein [Candidatus Calescibacterium sp.]|nr:LytTR family DNA-binding domain-containing protein [Candidatus Calescibacterium sp.]